ncbi:MAG: hypothetical protein Kow0080_14420 [Candidatus Promineifilaceae bacterium]
MTQNEQEHDTFLNEAADFLCRRGLRLPALIILEAGQPLAYLGGQMLWVAQPALSLFLPANKIRQTAQLLEQPTAVSGLIQRLANRN